METVYTTSGTAVELSEVPMPICVDDLLELTGEHQNFDIDSSTFGWKYFDDEEETSKEHLKNFKAMGRWFSQMAITERPKVIKQWREMASVFDYEWIDDLFINKLHNDKDMGNGVFNE